MPMRYFAAMLLIAATSLAAHAEIYECIDQDGNKRFTNLKAESRGCKVLNLGPSNTYAPGAKQTKASPSPADFPRVDPQTQQQRDGQRRRIIEQELSQEEQQLDQAKKDLAEQENTRLGSERNYQRVLDRLEPYKKKVKMHEENVASLRRELSNMR
ncbi:MAG TPA: DUF4124 domain-containing protein [Burkholderiales bacterium]|jgi:hypothetical protein